jgi:uncharacterized DUF497 family protein
MAELAFEWDPKKAEANLKAHGISFDEASTVFRNPLAQVLPDPSHSVGEERVLLVGHDAQGRVLMVVFTERQDRIRIISARVATKRERQGYEKHAKSQR